MAIRQIGGTGVEREGLNPPLQRGSRPKGESIKVEGVEFLRGETFDECFDHRAEVAQV
jgi:hypothetical protein